MLCLGIETSCDDTSLALVEDGKLIGQETSSQDKVHALFGGVVPELASREHARFIGPLFDRLMETAGRAALDIDVVAVARGPGLLGSLLVGMAFAKALCLGTGARLIGVNHLHAHLLAAGLERELVFPAVGLLVSGGHTDLYRISGPDGFTRLGRTLDDAAGEAFDKAGKMLGLPYPAGRIMDELAQRGKADPKLFPRPYLDNDSLDFSFSGLKTAMSVHMAKAGIQPAGLRDASGELGVVADAAGELADLCASFTLAVVETLYEKTRRALVLPACADAKSVIMAGGVAANSFLRNKIEALAGQFNKDYILPSSGLCTDNGAMSAYAGWLLAEKGYSHGLDLVPVPRGKAVPLDMLCAHSA